MAFKLPRKVHSHIFFHFASVTLPKKANMDLKNVQSQSMHLVLSTDAKPRLKWTPELHQRFIEAINQLGGSEKATPKSLMRVMGIPGLTLYHLKSHLQKYRLGKSHQLEICSDNKNEDCREIKSSDDPCSREANDGIKNEMNESMHIAQALQVQMEVQKKLYEQIEVQRHLQLKIEAQGKYLQSVLKKAQDTLAGYSSSTLGVEFAKAELSQLVSIINNACPSSPISELTETRGLSLSFGERKQNRGTMCSLESSLTSSEAIDHEEDNTQNHNSSSCSVELPLLAIHPEHKEFKEGTTSDEASVRKRSVDSDSSCVDQPSGKLRKSELSVMLDLNSQYQKDIDTSSKEIDLNCSSSFWGQ